MIDDGSDVKDIARGLDAGGRLIEELRRELDAQDREIEELRRNATDLVEELKDEPRPMLEGVAAKLSGLRRRMDATDRGIEKLRRELDRWAAAVAATRGKFEDEAVRRGVWGGGVRAGPN